MEIDTAVRHQAPVLIVVANNGAWQIEVHDQADNHGKVVGTRLQFADHAQMARACGMQAEGVEREEDLAPAIECALANRPSLLDVVVSPEARSCDGKTGLPGSPICNHSKHGMTPSAAGAPSAAGTPSEPEELRMTETGSKRVFDCVIIGAGSAGCVLANRLTGTRRSRFLFSKQGATLDCSHQCGDSGSRKPVRDPRCAPNRKLMRTSGPHRRRPTTRQALARWALMTLLSLTHNCV